MEYLRWILPAAESDADSKLVYLDWYSAHRSEPVIRVIDEEKGHTTIFHGGGTTDKFQVNDTHIHKSDNGKFEELECEDSGQLSEEPDRLPTRGRQEVIDDGYAAWTAIDHSMGERGHVQNGLTLPLDASPEALSSDFFEIWQ